MHFSRSELVITSALLIESNLVVSLSDGRIVIYPITGMTWITDVPWEIQQDFTVGEGEIYWNQIDDGLTLEHILSPDPRVDFSVDEHPDWKRLESFLARHKAGHRVTAEETI